MTSATRTTTLRTNKARLHPKFIEHWEKLGYTITGQTITSRSYSYGREASDIRLCTYWSATKQNGRLRNLGGLYVAVLASDGEMRYRLNNIDDPSLLSEDEAIKMLKLKAFW